VARYLLTVAATPRGAACEQDVQPFTETSQPQEATGQELRRLTPPPTAADS
jgi:hypothetical protein